MREEVVDALERVEEGRAHDVPDGLEGGRGDGARVRHDKKEIVQWMPWEERWSRGWEVGGEDIYADIVRLWGARDPCPMTQFGWCAWRGA